MSKKVLITGSDGQLGSEIKLISSSLSDIDFLFSDITELDITKPKQVRNWFSDNRIDFVVNCAAYTSVDKAEEERELAMLINAEAVKNLALAASESRSGFIHISTDFIFDGQKSTPYNENDIPNPISWYGYTKLEGEKNALGYCDDVTILRTSWLYSSFGQNFVKKIIDLGKTHKSIRVVNDQMGNPTNARDLAEVILRILEYSEPGGHKVYNYSNDGEASWYDFAKEIIKLAEIDCEVQPVSSEEFPTLAKRPRYSLLEKKKIKKDLDITVPHWKVSLKDCITRLSAENFIY